VLVVVAALFGREEDAAVTAGNGAADARGAAAVGGSDNATGRCDKTGIRGEAEAMVAIAAQGAEGR